MEPTKYPRSEGDIFFSKRLESARKDVERFFGILKVRFRILKLSLAYQQQRLIDYVFFTCCILHNMLHTYDGMDGLQEDVDWVGSAELQKTWEIKVDYSSVGARGVAPNDRAEIEAEHDVLKAQLITNFMYRKKRGEITWLSR